MLLYQKNGPKSTFWPWIDSAGCQILIWIEFQNKFWRPEMIGCQNLFWIIFTIEINNRIFSKTGGHPFRAILFNPLIVAGKFIVR